MSAIIVIDALWGDSGKGKIAAWLADKRRATLCVRGGTGTNSGHSLYLGGELIKTSQLPLAGIVGDAQLRVGSGVAVDPDLFEEEMSRYARFGVRERARIDGRCPVILPEYKDAERNDANLRETVGSTLSGTGWAQAMYCLRKAKQAKDIPALAPYLADVARECDEACAAGETIVLEGSQGTLLSLALTRDYPFCTSGNCTAMACADDVGLNWKRIGEVVMVVKAVPSRVGEGPLPFEMTETEQDARGIAEYGVRTGRRRRKASRVPMDLVEEAARLNGPTGIALSFCDHLNPDMSRVARPTPAVARLIAEVEEASGAPVVLLDRGKGHDAILERRTDGTWRG
jgi:adenylosuccinate synthase